MLTSESEVQAWLDEKTRLELVHACALKQLALHMGTLNMNLEIDGHAVQIREVTGQGGEVKHPQVAPSDVPTSSTPLASS